MRNMMVPVFNQILNAVQKICVATKKNDYNV